MMEATPTGVPAASNQANNRLFRDMVQRLPVGAVHVSGTELSVNRVVEELTGYLRSEIQTLGDWFGRVYRGDSERVRCLYEEDRKAGFPAPRTVTLTRKDGTQRDAEFQGYLYDQGEIWLIHDVSDKRTAQEALEFTRFAIECAAYEVFLIDCEGMIRYANRAASQRLGYGVEELTRMSVFDLDPHYSAANWLEAMAQLREAGRVVTESIHRTKSGALQPVEVVANHLCYRGEDLNWCFVRDISDRKRAEEEERRLLTRVQHSQKMESLGILAGGIAHEFNNLLTSVIGYSRLAFLELPDASPIREYLRQVDESARRASNLTQQMLAYAGKGRFLVQRFDLSDVVREVTHLLEVSVLGKGRIVLDLSDSLPSVEGDTAQIRQMMMNLVTNAAEALEESGGTILIKTGTQHCHTSLLYGLAPEQSLTEGEYVFLEVTDSGCGIPQADLGRVFEPFFTTKFIGRGLGLPAVLGIVRGHFGGIAVTSTPGEGTTFTVYLPAVENSDHSPLQEGTNRSSAEPGGGTILVVDDEEPVVRLAQTILEKSGYTVLIAEDGRQALEVFKRHATQVSAVLLDFTMPKMGGVETFKKLRKLQPSLRIVLTSGYSEAEATRFLQGKGLAGFIQKPFAPELLVSVMRKVIHGDPNSTPYDI